MIPPWMWKTSIFLNRITGGHPTHTLCARFYEWKLQNFRRGHIAVWITDTLFWFEPQHCRKAWWRRYQPVEKLTQ